MNPSSPPGPQDIPHTTQGCQTPARSLARLRLTPGNRRDDGLWRSTRGGTLIWVLLIAAALILMLAVSIYKYREDLLRYQRGPKSVPFVLHKKIANPLKNGRHFRQPVPSFSILGPLKDRHIVEKVLPAYPLWAEEQGVSGRIQLNFRVTSNGNVAPNIWVLRTIGYPEFDAVAINALKHWKFIPLTYPDIGLEQAGIINFNFTLINQPAHL